MLMVLDWNEVFHSLTERSPLQSLEHLQLSMKSALRRKSQACSLIGARASITPAAFVLVTDEIIEKNMIAEKEKRK